MDLSVICFGVVVVLVGITGGYIMKNLVSIAQNQLSLMKKLDYIEKQILEKKYR